MIIKNIKLRNFRNYENFEVKFSPINVIIGANGIGKTNIIEAVSILSYTKSFRSKDERNLIYKNEKYGQIESVLENDKNINFVITKNQSRNIKKEISINGTKKKLSEVIGNFKVVLFTPESLRIVTGAPGERRRFVDIVLSQIDKRYLENLIKYRQVLKQKNQLLKMVYERQTSPKGLDFWNNEIIKCSKYIMKARSQLIDFFRKDIKKTYTEISSHIEDRIDIVYEPRISDIEKIDEIVHSAQEREINAQKSIYGPHLDDIKFMMNRNLLSEIGSRGEVRSVVFSLKLAELKYIEKKDKDEKKAMLLLDDIFSELDKERRNKILKLIEKRQTIITTTEKELVDLQSRNINFINLNKSKKYEKN